MRLTIGAVVLGALFGSCQSPKHNDPPAPPKLTWPTGQLNVRLEAGTYDISGVRLSDGATIIGAGMDKTFIRLASHTRLAINGWLEHGCSNVVLRGFTLDCGARSTDTNFARCGIGGSKWSDSVIERVRVVGLGSFSLKAGLETAESFGFILSDSTNCVIRDCVVEKNTGGYVNAFCLSGRDMQGSNLVARFNYDNGWRRFLENKAGILLAFTVGGGSKPHGSRNVSYVNCHTENAVYGVFCDTGYRVDGLRLDGISGTLRSYPFVPKHGVVLHGETQYLNIVTNNVILK